MLRETDQPIGSENTSYLNVMQKYHLRRTGDRLDDFRATLIEIVGSEMHGQPPRDIKELDSENYGKTDQALKANGGSPSPHRSVSPLKKTIDVNLS